MHGLNPFRSPVPEQPQREGIVTRGFRHLFGTPVLAQLFSADGLMEAPSAEAQVQGLMRRLTARMVRGHNRIWPDPLPPGTGPAPRELWENPDIPSGYTYLLQLIAHDLVASSVSLSLDRGVAEVENTRARPLALDTVYGGGPDVCPHPYEFSAEHRDRRGLVPRTRLRVGPARPPNGNTGHCPFRDIGRATATDAVDGGRDTEARKGWRTEALVADARNDSHALLSQITVLFHVLHNELMERLEKRAPAQPAWLDTEVAYRRFLAARLAATMIYRNIVEKDVLKRVLHPQIYDRYLTNPAFPLDPERGIPKEFSHGAFRFAHAMVRDEYRVNGPELQPMTRALNQSTTRSPGSVPVRPEWLVDWSLFFPIGGSSPNLSRRIGPDYAAVLQNEGMFPPLARGDAGGIAFRDYLSSCFANLRKVPDLWHEFASLLPPFETWKAPLRRWLEEIPGSPLSEPFESGDVDRLVNDPPLPFFVQFEAAHTVDRTGRPVREGGGRHLGHLGSLIVGETIFGAMRRHPIGFEEGNPTLRGRMAACCRSLLDDPDALADVKAGAPRSPARDIETMADLIGFLQAGDAFPKAGPA
jgi:hypothetical protein